MWVQDVIPGTRLMRLTVGPVEQTVSQDKTQIFVSGTIRNAGEWATREVTVKVTAQDEASRTVAQQEDVPQPPVIPPGGEAHYVVQIPNDPTITGFHVEAIGR